jgi:hypothetical protein
VDADRLEGRQAGDDEEDGASRKRRQRRLRNVEQGAVEPPVAMIEGRPEPVNRNHHVAGPGPYRINDVKRTPPTPTPSPDARAP